jgi:hypothetical protein
MARDGNVPLTAAAATTTELSAFEPSLEAVATHVEPAAKKRKTRVCFDHVKIYNHEPALTNDRVPSSGGPSIGLGKLSVVTLRRIESFDERRDPERTGVRHIDAEERRQVLSELHRCESVEANENSIEEVQRCREESNLEPPSPRVPEPPKLFPLDDEAKGGSLPQDEAQFDEVGVSDLW